MSIQGEKRFASMEEFVAHRNAKRVIKKILVANNGIAAVKCMRSMRQWLYQTCGSDALIEFVAMATPEDLRVGAEYIKLADAYEEVAGGKNNRNYANVDVIVDVAKRNNCDAVWAGWGHASEFPTLPSALEAADIVFLGPGATAMRDLGDKIASTILAQSANVSCIPWSGDGVTVDYKSEGIPRDKYLSCCVGSVDEARKVVERIGLPVMIKASEGGGGKGIRKVEKMEQLVDSYSRVAAEVPGSPIFLMRMGSECRHLEVQIIGDEFGNALALYGRDCSIQRRHQKVIEEGPVVVAPAETRREMEQAAVRLAKEVGYVGAGTIEYLYTGGNYYFLELNPRLQVEHPVTELISDVNLPAAQLCVGMGMRLDMIPQIRAMYRQDPLGETPIDFETCEARPPKGHVIACRITAENARKGFQPTSGSIQELNFRSIPNVWGYFSVSSGGGVHEFADSQIGHLFAWGPDRNYCRDQIIMGLSELSIRGDISTPVDYLIKLMETPEFRSNTIDTAWLDSLIAAGSEGKMLLPSNSDDDLMVVICGAACQAYRKHSERVKEFTSQLTDGRVPTRQLLELKDRLTIIYSNVEYVVDVNVCGPGSFAVQFVTPSSGPLGSGSPFSRPMGSSSTSALAKNAEDLPAIVTEVRPFADGGMLVLVDGKSNNCYLSENAPLGWKLVLNKKQHLLENPRDPTKIFTPSNGKIVKYLVPSGSHVTAGTAFVECEIMKMILPLVCDIDGTLTFPHAEGTVVEAGELIARVEPDDLSTISKARPFQGKVPAMKAPRAPETKPYLLLQEVQRKVEHVLQGYFCPDIEALVDDYLEALCNRNVPVSWFAQSLSEHKAALPATVLSALDNFLAAYKTRLLESKDGSVPFPAAEMIAVLDTHAKGMKVEAEGKAWLNSVSGLRATLAELKEWDVEHPEQTAVRALLKLYLSIESAFEGRPQEVVMMEFRDEHKANLEHVYNLCLSYYSDMNKVPFLSALLSEMGRRYRVQSMRSILHQVYVLPKPRHVQLSLMAGRVLSRAGKPSPEQGKGMLLQEIAALSEDAAEDELSAKARDILVKSPFPLEALHCAYDAVESRPRVAGAVFRQYVSLLIASLPFEEAEALTSKTAPRLSFQWLTAPVDINDQGLPPASSSSSSSSSAPAPVAATEPPIVGNVPSLDVPARARLSSSTGPNAKRSSLACVFENVNEAREALGTVLETYKQPNDATTRNILMLVLLDGSDLVPPPTPGRRGGESGAARDSTQSNAASRSGAELQELLLKPHAEKLLERRIVRVTVVVARFPQPPLFHSFRLRHGFREDLLYRNFVPELGFLLELRRLDRYDLELCATDSARVLVYEALERLPPDSKRSPASREKRLFARAFVNIHPSTRAGEQLDWSRSVFQDVITKHESAVHSVLRRLGTPEQAHLLLRMMLEVEQVFVEALNGLEEAIMTRRREVPSATNSLFIATMTELSVSEEMVAAVVPLFMSCFAERLHALNVHLMELVVTGPASTTSKSETHRFVVTNYSGVLWRVHSASEMRSLSMGVPSPRLQLGSSRTELNLLSSETPYIPNANVSTRRRHCRLLGTTYVYDYKDVLERALYRIWADHQRKHGAARREKDWMSWTEYRLDGQDVMHACDEESTAGSNTIGMLAWKVTVHTPEYPDGRDFVLIANDVSFSGGSFGPREDALFHQASQLARHLGIPRIYLSANAGARIGLANEVMKYFQVAWKDASNPSLGFEYLYVTPEDLEKMGPTSVKVAPVEGHPDRLQITDIIGLKHGIGVENLQGSGLIAGETALAYKETFTLTIVTGRSVGIGAYVTRLGQRVIQNQGPILLTGYDALNRLLGREVYISNTQLGGPNIMYRNGVSHLDVTSDLEAMTGMLQWLSYVPRARGEPLPVHAPNVVSDPLTRPVKWTPTPSVAYDPRHLLSGFTGPDGQWQGGFFDHGSFVETLGGWARTVVTGRARLGGIPVGVIAVETRTVQKVVPADPASDDSREQVSQQAGQVWFPDSSHKTAQAIRDFNNGEQLPLFVFANWRGFSGGVSDMANEVLKFGSMIVDALAEFKQPVFVYLPPFAELRGGSWAVIDPFVNPYGMVEMYCSESAQGGILEATGTVSIKYRKREQLATMERLDEELRTLLARRRSLQEQQAPADQVQEVAAAIAEREETLSRAYHSVALRFCELHDTPGRMLEKKVVSDIVPWAESRLFFGRRLARRLAEVRVEQQGLDLKAISAGFAGDLNDDEKVAAFLTEALSKQDGAKRRAVAAETVQTVAAAVNAGDETTMEDLLKSLSAEAKEALLAKLKAK